MRRHSNECRHPQRLALLRHSMEGGARVAIRLKPAVAWRSLARMHGPLAIQSVGSNLIIRSSSSSSSSQSTAEPGVFSLLPISQNCRSPGARFRGLPACLLDEYDARQVSNG